MRATSGVMSRTMPVMAAIDNMRAEKASKAPSLSACMSFWEGSGHPFITISSASSAPMMRPVLARTSSAASGLRFCGMMEEPVVKRSESDMRPTSGEHQITISSAKRDRCTAVMAAAASVSSTKSRSETASSEFAIRAAKPRALAVMARAIGKAGAAGGCGAARRKVRALARIRESAAVASGHLHIGKEMMAEGHGLGDLQMGEARHHGRCVFERLFRECALVGGERRIDGIDRRPDPQSEIGGDLVVARSRGMQPPRRGTDQLGQPAFDVHMDVLERALELKLAALDL